MAPPPSDGGSPPSPDNDDLDALLKAAADSDRAPPQAFEPARGPDWLADDGDGRVPLPPLTHDAETGAPLPDTSAYGRPNPAGLEALMRIVAPDLTPLRPMDPDASGTPGPDTSAFGRPSAMGMNDLLKVIPGQFTGLRPMDEDASGTPAPDTSAFGRPNPPGMEDLLKVIPTDMPDLRPVDEDASGTPEPDTSAYSRPNPPGMEDLLKVIPSGMSNLRPVDEDASGTPEPDTSAYSRPNPPGMEDLLKVIPSGMPNLRPMDEDASGTPEPDTSAYSRPNPPGEDARRKIIGPGGPDLRPVDPDASGTPEPDTGAFARPSAPDPDEERPVIAPTVPSTTGSNLEPLLAVPVLEVSPQLRAAHARQAEPPPPEPQGPPALIRVQLSSAAGPGQVCPECGGALREVRYRREDRLDATWFNLEWLELSRALVDCPKHPQVETLPHQRPAFLAPIPVGNGLLAWIATWRWRDHMPGHEIARVLTLAGLRCSEAQVSRWLARPRPTIGAVAAALRTASGGKTDDRGLEVIEGNRKGRLKATVAKDRVTFSWAPDDAPRSPDDPTERARDALFASRGWSREGRQAALRRKAAFVMAADPARGRRLSWLLESLRQAADRAAEDAALASVDALIDAAEDPGPALAAVTRLVRTDREALHRFDEKGKPAPPLPRPEHVRLTLPPWYTTLGDGGAEALADWLTVLGTCDATGVAAWSYLRDLFTAAAEQGDAFDADKWKPGRKR